jgi:hypothetical protein
VRALAPLQAAAGLLVYGPAARALALLAWQNGLRDEQRQSLARRARAARQMAELFAQGQPRRVLEDEAATLLHAFFESNRLR